MPGDGGNTNHQSMAKPYKLTAQYLYGSSNSTYFDMIKNNTCGTTTNGIN